MALVVPPSFVDASRHQPCRVLTYSSPITGATGKGLLSHLRFLLAAPGFYSQRIDVWAFHQPPTLWTQQLLLLVPSRLLLYSVVTLIVHVYHGHASVVKAFSIFPTISFCYSVY